MLNIKNPHRIFITVCMNTCFHSDLQRPLMGPKEKPVCFSCTSSFSILRQSNSVKYGLTQSYASNNRFLPHFRSFSENGTFFTAPQNMKTCNGLTELYSNIYYSMILLTRALCSDKLLLPILVTIQRFEINYIFDQCKYNYNE